METIAEDVVSFWMNEVGPTRWYASDEALDAEVVARQAAEMRKLEAEAAAGRTIVLVSHDMDAIAAFCERVVHLEHGVIRCDGTVEEALASYHEACGTEVGDETA